jgi:hypothetical protein
MKYDRTLHVKCPMCGYDNKISEQQQNNLGVKEGRPFIVLCDNEEGGCDRYFVVEVTLTAHVHSFVYGDTKGVENGK